MSGGALPLERFTVIDLTRVRSGPTCVRLFADWGANCIKVEAPEAIDKSAGMGGARHGPDFQNIHRNKRGVTLNIKKPEGRDVFLRLVEKADVVVENFRPDVKTRLGVNYEALSAVNPRVILTSISAFGQDGPYAGRPGFDQIAQGMGGLMSITGEPGTGPMRVGIPIADLSAGNFAAMGTLVALLEREVSGRGQWVRTSLIESMIAMLDFQAARYLISGEVPGQAGNNHPTTVPTGVFKTKDGHINIAGGGDVMWRRICEALEADDLANDPELATEDSRRAARDKVNNGMEKHTITKTSAEWIDILNEIGVPSGRINAMDEVFADEQVQHIRMERPVQHPDLGEINVVGQAISMSRSEPHYARATPERGQHTDEILADAGFSAEDIQALRDKQVI